MIVRAQIAPGEDDQIGDEEKDGLADTYGVSATWDGDALFAALAYQRSYLEVDSPVPPPVTVAAMVARRRGAVALSQWETPCTRRSQPLSWPSWSNTAPKSSRAARVGITVIAPSMEIRIDADTAMAMSE